MKKILKNFMLSVSYIFILSACAAVYTDASDSNHVTFLNSSGESIEQLTQTAGTYCAQYGITASFRSSDTQLYVVFDCKPSRN